MYMRMLGEPLENFHNARLSLRSSFLQYLREPIWSFCLFQGKKCLRDQNIGVCLPKIVTQLKFTCSKSTKETVTKGVKYVQS